MTECERFIEEGIFKSDFFKPETRCDFFVDENRKKNWAVELDLLFKFDAVCKKYNLKYFLMYGSLLGAVRHNGFIPWDDDLDVAMLREDYEKFIQLSSEFDKPYFLQTPYTDEEYFFSFAKLRNSNTTAMSKMFIYQNYNKGIFIDIFPIDNFDETNADERYKRIKFLGMENSTYMRRKNPNLDEKNILRVKNHSGIKPLDAYEEIQSLAQCTENSNSENVSLAVWTVYDMKRMIYKRSDFEEALYWEVEGIKVPIPCGYKNILKTLYGDYMQLPPIQERGGWWHSDAIFDPDISYKNYLPENIK